MTRPDILDRKDRAIINAFQGGFPVVDSPFEPAASALTEAGVSLDAAELLDRIQRLDDQGVLSRFGPLINADEIGGKTTLVAMSVPESRFEDVASTVNEFPEVAHNYERSHELNMWFVLSVPDPNRIESVLAAIERKTGLETFNLPKYEEFRLEARFPIEGPLEGGIDLSTLGPEVTPDGSEGLTPPETDLVVEIQDGLPLTEKPYETLANRLDLTTEQVLRTTERLRVENKIRRIGVIPNHYALGYTENAMTVWNVDDSDVSTVGKQISGYPFVTHCYERPRHEQIWPYNLFAMVHGVTERECQERIDQVRETVSAHTEISDADWETLYSTRILKKTGIRIGDRAGRTDTNAERAHPTERGETG